MTSIQLDLDDWKVVVEAMKERKRTIEKSKPSKYHGDHPKWRIQRLDHSIETIERTLNDSN